VGARGVDRLLSSGPHRRDRRGLTAVGGSATSIPTRTAGHPRPAGADAVHRRGRAEAHPGRCQAARPPGCCSAGIMLQKPNLLIFDEADQPPRPRVDQRAPTSPCRITGHGG
jgi:hypothetical protein